MNFGYKIIGFVKEKSEKIIDRAAEIDWFKFVASRTRVLSAWCIIAAAAIAVNVYAGSICIVEVNDNGVITTYKTTLMDADEFFNENGITINEGDIVVGPKKLTPSSQFVITRSFDVDIIAGGVESSSRSTPATVAQILADNNIVYDEDDVISHPLDEYVTSDISLVVDYIETITETEDKVVPSYSRYLNGSSSAANGDIIKRSTYEVRYVNGIEQERTLLDKSVVLNSGDSLVVDSPATVEKSERSQALASRGSVHRYSKIVDVVATAYTHTGYRTATMTYPKVGTVAVDPSIIPLGSRLYIESLDGQSWTYGYAVAEDTGGLIKGARIDLFMDTRDECVAFGVRDARVYILD